MSFDAELATKAYIDGLGAEALAEAAAYTTGNQWIMLWSLVVSIISTWLIIRSGILNRLNDRFANSSLFTRAFVVSAVFMIVSAIIELPWAIYTSWYRQLQYDMTSQPLGDFLSQSGIGLAISSVIAGL